MWKTGYTPHIDYMNEPVGETLSLKETQDMYQAVLAAFTTFTQHGFRRLGRRCTRKLRYNDPEILIGDKLSASIPEALASDLETHSQPGRRLHRTRQSVFILCAPTRTYPARKVEAR